MIKKYTKIPVEIEAIQFTGYNNAHCQAFIGDNFDNTRNYPNIKTDRGVMRVNKGDFIIKGVEGEFYPCDPDVFKKTYSNSNECDTEKTSEDNSENKI